jgi:hypothetical protein
VSARDNLIAELTQRLELDHQYVEDVPAFDQDRIDLVRSSGRVAARTLGWKVRTFALDLDDGRTRLIVAITYSTPEDQERISERGHLLIQEALEDWGN